MKRFYKLINMYSLPVWVHWSLPFMLAVLLVDQINRVDDVFSLQDRLMVILLLLVSMMLAELAQYFTATFLGGKVRRVVLLPLGGVMSTKLFLNSNWKKVLFYLAGPFVNICLTLFAFSWLPVEHKKALLDFQFSTQSPGFWYFLLVINLGLGGIQLLPAFPLKGGNLIRDLLTPVLGRKMVYQILVPLGVTMAVFIIVAGVFYASLLVMLGIVLLVTNYAEVEMEKQRQFTSDLTVKHVMNRNILVTSSSESIEDILLKDSFWNKELVIVENNKPVGIISPEQLTVIFRYYPMNTLLKEVMDKCFQTVKVKQMLEDIYSESYCIADSVYIVMQTGKVVGVIRLPEVYSVLTQVQKDFTNEYAGLMAS